MELMSYTDLRANLSSVINKVNNDSLPIFITRNHRTKAVLLSIDDYNAMQETFYLMSDPVNDKKITEAMKRVEAGQFIERELIE